jgi:hypothetical protein
MKNPDQKTVVVGTQSLAAMLATSLKGVRVGREILPEGDGWVTHRELMGSIREATLKRRAAAAVQQGLWEVFRGTKYSEAANGPRPCTWYRIKATTASA